MLDVHEFESANQGPTLTIFGAIHGNEIVGPVTLKTLIEKLNSGEASLAKGKLIIVPICNPKAHAENKRYIDVNLNRLFGATDFQDSYEATLANELMKIIEKSDYLLDIHSTHTSGDPAFVFAEEKYKESINFAKATGVEKICLGWNDVYQEDDFSTEAFALRQGRIGNTLECGFHEDASCEAIATRGINGALNYTGIMPIDISSNNDVVTEFYRFKSFVTYSDGDKFVKPWIHMDSIKKGDPVYCNVNGDVWSAPEDGCILIPNPAPLVGDELFYFGVKEDKDLSC